MNEAAVQNHNGAGFNHLDPNAGANMLDPSAFMNNPSTFDPSQFQNQQLQQRMQQNGGMRNGSPAFNSPVYQTNSIVPSKRPRPREDSLGTSPRQAPGMLPNSRSQTPQQSPYPGFQPNSVPQQHAPQQNPYSHLQNGSANTSPSPIMANQLRPGGVVPQRVSTASPHPFSPAAQQFAPQASPSQSEHGSRVDTPQNNPYAQNPAFAQGFNPNFTPPPGRTSAPPQTAMGTPQMQQMPPQMFNQMAQQQGGQARPGSVEQQQKAMYQMRLQQQLQQQTLMAAQRQNMPPNANPMANPQMQGANTQYPGGMRPQQVAAQQQRGPNPESFMKSLVAFMQSKNLPLDLNPMVGDRKVSIMTLYMAVVKFGGFKKVTAANGWGSVAQALHFNPQQQPSAALQLKHHYEKNLALFEEAWMLNQQRQRMNALQQGQAGQMAGQMSPTKQINPQAMQQSQQSQHFLQQQQLMAQQNQIQQQQQMQGTPVKQMGPAHHPQQPSLNGFSTPQPGQGQPQIGGQGHSRNSLSRSVDATPVQNGTSFTMSSPVSAAKPGSLSLASPQVETGLGGPPAPQEFNLPAELDPKVRVLDTHGGVEVESLLKLGGALIQYKPDVPAVVDLGTIDIHAITLSLQSGIHSEVRLALDTLVSLSVESRLNIDLRSCEDLVEVLVDCAEDQVELLAESATEVSDVMLVNSYEDVVRGCRCEQELLQDIPAFGTPEYDLDRAVDRLICITTIMRNLSFYEPNGPLLADELVIKFLCVVIRYLGTRNMLLRTNQNTLDFMKDVIIFLSNLAQAIELSGREQALCLLHFLIAFAPCPPPNIAGSDRVNFSPYDPAIHLYLPPAVDSLAKLLARDEPNRTHYKTIFASDIASSPPFDLLTKTFALAIAAIPDNKQDPKRGNLASVTEARKPFLMQGMLAAEILSSLAPGFETGVAKSWLTSDDGFAQNLSRLVVSVCLEAPQHAPHQRQQVAPRGVEDEALFHITLGGISVLRRLAEKCKDPENRNSTIPVAGMPTKESLLQALRIVQPRLKVVLKQLCAYAGLDS